MASLRSVKSSAISTSAKLLVDILTDILCRLSIKSLIRFKCVSKSMFALLSSPSFTKKHLSLVIHNNLILMVYPVSANTGFFFVAQELSEAKRVVPPFMVGPIDKFRFCGSCNGLICISRTPSNNDIVLYNSSTKAYKRIPGLDFNVNETLAIFSLGFGYLPRYDDYKLVTVVGHHTNLFGKFSFECEAGVYSLNADKWKKLGRIPFRVNSEDAMWLQNGFLVWRATGGIEDNMTPLLFSFGMEKEIFMEIPKPKLIKVASKINHIWLSNFNGFLSISHKIIDVRMDIWMMKEFGVKESWTKLYVIEPPLFDVNLNMWYLPLCVLENGEILVQKNGRALVLYDPQRGTLQDVNIRGLPQTMLQ